jgi:ABC-type ATPase involved in cell division/GNAT superfamily N-acetyltransferase
MYEMTMLNSTVETDEITEQLSRSFDYEFAGTSSFVAPRMPDIPESFGIGLIVGPSGSGKSTLLKRFGIEADITWDTGKAICSHFASAVEAQARLSAVGLNSIPAWMRPYQVLSTGEKFRADLARRLVNGAVVDEFTSVVDRNVAKACSYALRRYCDQQGLSRMVFASCHYDIIEWLQPDWVFDTNTGQLVGRGSERRPQIKLEIVPCSSEAWAIFSKHHYLSHKLNKAARCWLVLWNGTPVGFASALAFPNGNMKNAWREHRTVVLPDYQGLGLGVRISDAVARMFKEQGCRYFSKTSHPRMGGYRESSPLWKPTSKNKKARRDYNPATKTKEDGHKLRHANRVCYSHEFVGNATPDDGSEH